MRVQIKTKGFKEASQVLKHKAAILSGLRGNFYEHQSKIIQEEIENNCDASYINSPAKDMAVQSAAEWMHLTRLHKNKIYSHRFANYRQYGCGGLPIALLVYISENGKRKLMLTAIEDLAK